MKSAILNRLFLLSLIFVMAVTKSTGQPQKDKDANQVLYKEIAQLDSVVFTAFNNRDTSLFKKMFADDLEFFHDIGGLTGYEQTINFLRSNTTSRSDLRRDLVKGSLEVYPIPGYGAIEIGSHTFCHTENGKPDCGTFKFVQVWKKVHNEWKIARVVSYGH
jgi:hypothetical protein